MACSDDRELECARKPKFYTPPPARGAARGPTTPEPTQLPLSTSQTSLPAVTSSQVVWLMWAGAEAAEEAGGGVSTPPPRADRGAAMLRATRPGGGRRIDLSSCPGAQAG